MSTSSLPFSPLLGGVLSLVVGFIGLVIVLAIQFPDRAIFTRKRKDVPLMKGGIPILGNLYQGLEHRGRRLDRELDLIKEYGIVRRITAWPIFRKSVDVIISNHPMDVSHVMSGEFGCVACRVVGFWSRSTTKADRFHTSLAYLDPYLFVKDAKEDDTFGVLLGDGIFIRWVASSSGLLDVNSMVLMPTRYPSLVTSDGHAWKTSRKIASNLFTIKGFRDFFSKDFVEECDRLSEHLRAAAKKNMFVDLQELLLRCTLDSFVRLALGKDPQCLHGEGTNVDGRYTLPFSKFMKSFDQLVFLCSLRGADPLWNITEHFNGKRKQVLECAEVVNSFAYDVIKEKREVMAKKQEKAGSSKSGEEDRQDLLDHFMASKNDDGSDLSDKQLRDAVMSWCRDMGGLFFPLGKSFSNRFLSQFLDFTLAGRDTTAQTLSWCFWELAQRPEWEEKLREEAMRVLGPDGPTTFESLKELPLTYAFFNETLRLHGGFSSDGNIKRLSMFRS